MIQTLRLGRGICLTVKTSSKSGAGVLTPLLGFRLDRPGFRPFRVQCRQTSSLTSIGHASQSRSAAISTTLSDYSQRTPLRRLSSRSSNPHTTLPEPKRPDEEDEQLSESPYTIPNALTVARLIACPFLGYQIVQGDYVWATSLLFACGISDWLDGYLARHYSGKSVLGSILDPAADKALMTTLVVTLAWAGLLPVPLAVLILGRDIALVISAFYYRYKTLPPPHTLSRYFDPSITSAEVKPTQISKINTALQLVLMGVTTVSPLISYPLAGPLEYLQWTVAATTIWSGLSYVRKAGFRLLPRRGKKAD